MLKQLHVDVTLFRLKNRIFTSDSQPLQSTPQPAQPYQQWPQAASPLSAVNAASDPYPHQPQHLPPSNSLHPSRYLNPAAARERLQGLFTRVRSAITTTSPVLHSLPASLRETWQDYQQYQRQLTSSQLSPVSHLAARQGQPLNQNLDFNSVSKEPLIQVIGDSVVMVLKPREFMR
jgi:hypothetical protein